MASIALSIVGCIDYLAYGSIFTHAVFPFIAKEVEIEFLIPAKKPKMFTRRRCPANICVTVPHKGLTICHPNEFV